jgi:DNA-binding protein H-NS
MSIDELWALHAAVDQILAARLIAEKRELEKRLEQLGQPTAWGDPAEDYPAKH